MAHNNSSLARFSSGSPNPIDQDERPAICVFDAPENLEQLAGALSKIGYRTVPYRADMEPEMSVQSFSAALISDSVAEPLRHAAAMSTLCPVVFVTSEVSIEARLCAARAGVCAILSRPLDLNELAEWLNDLVGPHLEKPLSILIVDDDEIVAETHALALENAGMRTSVETVPAAAFGKITATYPDLVLMDIKMPGVSGIELVKAIRQSRLYVSLPIVFLSAERDPARQLEARKLGGDDFISKPVDPQRLVSLVRMRADRAIRLRSIMDRDSLTGLLNRGRFIERLYHELERCQRTETEVSLVLIDIDSFKSINDTYGHQNGDQVLRTLAHTLSDGLRRIDIIGRYGGEEFGVLLLDTPVEAACAVVDKLRRRFSEIEFDGKSSLFSVTFSAGVSGSRGISTPEELIAAADEHMYLAKAGGRNKVVGKHSLDREKTKTAEQALLQHDHNVLSIDFARSNGRRGAVDRLQRENARLQQLVEDRVAESISVQALIDKVPDYLWIKDIRGRFVIANKAIAFDNGRAEPGSMIGLTDFDLHAPEAAREFFALEQHIMRTGKPMIDNEEFIVEASGATKWLSSTKVALHNVKNEVVGIVGISRDITARKFAEDLANGQAEVLEMVATNAPLGDVLERQVHLLESQILGIVGSILILDADGIHMRHGAAPSLPEDYRNSVDGFSIRSGVSSSDTVAHRRETVIPADVATNSLREGYRQLASAHGYYSCWSTPIMSHRGAVLGAVAMYSKETREPNAAETRLIAVASRIAGIAIERRQAEERILFMANHDALTGLPNRLLLKDRLTQAILYADKNDRWATILFIDLDNFRLVNDSLGYNSGDELLKIVAERMVRHIGVTDTLVSLGGDKFAILLFDQPKSADIITIALQRVRAAIAEPILVDGHNLRVTCSIGIAHYPEDGVDADILIANADTAMYRAKEIGRDNFQFYAPELDTKSHEKLVLLEELRNAVIRSEFVLHYQPQVDLRTGRVFAVEALIRWTHPTRGVLSPIEFIPLAEDSGLIVPIGDWVLCEACRQNKEWQDAGMPKMTVCVNVSARQFKEKSLVFTVGNSLKKSRLEAKHLEVELTESLIMQDIDAAVATMRELQALGVHLSIDDFGIGYSSLAALKSFPVTRLKIDKSFISEVATNENDQAVTTAVISLGQKLNLRVLAEGVESDDQIAFLRENNCDEMQGYHFSRPVPAGEIERLIRLTL
jgi:diguanylate cyclase (GGDEF)-like protein/PAS domain S-box-containing protein